MRAELIIELEGNDLGPWVEVYLQPEEGKRIAVASYPVNPNHSHKTPMECGLSILADKLKGVLSD